MPVKLIFMEGASPTSHVSDFLLWASKFYVMISPGITLLFWYSAVSFGFVNPLNHIETCTGYHLVTASLQFYSIMHVHYTEQRIYWYSTFKLVDKYTLESNTSLSIFFLYSENFNPGKVYVFVGHNWLREVSNTKRKEAKQ